MKGKHTDTAWVPLLRSYAAAREGNPYFYGELADVLEKYANHTKECERWPDGDIVAPCTCGLDKEVLGISHE